MVTFNLEKWKVPTDITKKHKKGKSRQKETGYRAM